MFHAKIYLISFMSVILLYMLPIHAVDPNPYDFNVYMSGNIGTSSSAYGSDFQGLTGSGGNAYFGGFSGNLNGPAFLYSVYSGGSFNMNSGTISNGGVEARGPINMSSTTINGNVHGGGNLMGGNGTINGNASLAGINTSNITIGGSIFTNQASTPSLNLNNVTNYFHNASAFWGGLAPTATFNNVFGQIQVSNLQSGRNIVNLSLADLNNAYGIQLNGPANAFVIFNFTDATPTLQILKDVTFNLSGGINQSDVLYNFINATQLALSGGQYLSILANQADITFPSGLVTGNLIAKNLFGSGQANSGVFSGFQIDQNNFSVGVPEPSTYLILSSFIAILMVMHSKKRLLPQKTH